MDQSLILYILIIKFSFYKNYWYFSQELERRQHVILLEEGLKWFLPAEIWRREIKLVVCGTSWKQSVSSTCGS